MLESVRTVEIDETSEGRQATTCGAERHWLSEVGTVREEGQLTKYSGPTLEEDKQVAEVGWPGTQAHQPSCLFRVLLGCFTPFF